MHNRSKKWGPLAMSLVLGAQLLSPLGALAADSAETGFTNGTGSLDMTKIASYASGQCDVDGGVMEIIAYNTANGHAYGVNGKSGKLTILPLNQTVSGALGGEEVDVKQAAEEADPTFAYGDMTSVAVSPDGKTLAVALQAAAYDQAGRAAFFACQEDGSLQFLGLAETGVQPDMITFADNDTALTADEGEPRMGYGQDTTDPKGSVTILHVAQRTSQVVDFSPFDSQRNTLTQAGIVLKKDTAPSVDLEPEYIAVADGKAYVTLQEANAIAVLDLASQTFTGIYSCGFEDYSQVPVDIDKKDEAYAPKTYDSLRGIRMPDGIAAFTQDGTTYLVTANEGDSREWGDEDLGTAYLNEDERDFKDGDTSPSGALTAENAGLRGKVVFFLAEDYDGLDADKDYLFGGRSFTVYQVGQQGLEEVYTSGDDFEALTAQYLPEFFNCSNDNAVVDDRSGKKGPEAESVTVGQVDDKTYAFVALERTGGVMAYDLSQPETATFVNYINSRDFSTVVEGSQVYEDGELDKWVTGGDVAPEGLAFVAAQDSATGQALLLAACEVSGTVAVYQLSQDAAPAFSDVSESDWFYEAVTYVSENGLMTGVANDRFAPNATLSRAMMVTILYRLEDQPQVSGQSDFADVPADTWYTDAVAWATEQGIVNGVENNCFAPNDGLTREQMAVILYRFAQYKGLDVAADGDLSAFPDGADTAPWATEAMVWAVDTGLIQGAEGGSLAPQGTSTRAQAATVLARLCQSWNR